MVKHLHPQFLIFTESGEMRQIFAIVLVSFLSCYGYSQSHQLAENYFEQGEYEKALLTYEKLAQENPRSITFLYGIIASYQQLERYPDAEKLLLEKLQSTANSPELLVELGHNYELQQDREKADTYYEEALRAIEARPNYADAIGRQFEKYSLLDRAVEAYETGMKLSPSSNYNIQLARLYGEQGKVDKMFGSYLDLVEENNSFLPAAYRSFSQFITSDPENEANQIFRKLVLQKLQQTQHVMFNELLGWLFIQQNEFGKAFNQEKAIYRRSEAGVGRLIRLAVTAQEKEPETAVEVLEFITAEAASEDLVLQAQQMKLNIQQDLSGPEGTEEVERAYQQLFEQYGTGLKTLPLQVDYAEFLGFSAGKIEEGVQVLKTVLEKNPAAFDEAMAKMMLADLLVLDGKFNQALIYYSQVQQLVKNNQLAQDARYKVAKTSYYKGDFEWAKTQLDVLKSSTSQLIANDAMELSLLIQDNVMEDSTHTALKLYAKADLLSFQEKPMEAIAILDTVLTNHKAEAIEDEAMLKQAELYIHTGDYEQAEENYLQLVEHHKNGILGDNAHFGLAQLYDLHLANPEKAQEFYEKIIFNYPDSIYFVDARRRYRQIRGE